jgi:hypothetical protein
MDMPAIPHLYVVAAVVALFVSLLLVVPGKSRQWFKRRFKEFDLLEQYFPLLFTRWQAALWGGSVLAVAFGWHFVTADWPYPVKVTACIAALFFAGYYVWRVDHIRLMPKLELVSLHTPYTPTNAPNLQRKFVQLLVKCKTEGPLNDCGGQLLRVMKWSAFHGEWQPTQIDEMVDLLWSNLDVESTTLEPGADRRLNLFFIDTDRHIIPRVNQVPMRMILNFAPANIFRFDVRVAAKGCLPEFASVKATIGQNWDDIQIEEIPKENLTAS